MPHTSPSIVEPIIAFPDPRAVIAEDSRRFRALSPQERWREIFSIRGWGDRQARASSRQGVIERLWADEEARWQEIQRSLFATHGT